MTDADDAQSIRKSSSVADKQLSNLSPAGGKNGAVVQCPLKVTVKITPKDPIGCPGHPLKLTAEGTPAGGTYAWNVENADWDVISGDGSSITVRKVPAADSTGRIPPTNAKATVTYTYSGCQAQDASVVKIHEIRFLVSGVTIEKSLLEAKRHLPDIQAGWATSDSPLPYKVTIGPEKEADGVPLIKWTPRVTIQLDRSCPRAADCAKNYRTGFIQDLTAGFTYIQYRHRRETSKLNIGPPIRDGLTQKETGGEEIPFPFMYDPVSFSPEYEHFSDTVSLEYEDSPGLQAISNPDTNPDWDNTVEQMVLKKEFTTWLVVQSVEWRAYKGDKESLIFLKYFRWSVDHTARRNQAGQYAPQYSDPKSPTEADSGMGASSPSLTDEVANDPKSWNDEVQDDAPPVHPPSKHRRH